MTLMIRPYIPKIPAMTTGTTDLMIKSGLSTPMVEMPIPLFADPYAEPISMKKNDGGLNTSKDECAGNSKVAEEEVSVSISVNYSYFNNHLPF